MLRFLTGFYQFGSIACGSDGLRRARRSPQGGGRVPVGAPAPGASGLSIPPGAHRRGTRVAPRAWRTPPAPGPSREPPLGRKCVALPVRADASVMPVFHAMGTWKVAGGISYYYFARRGRKKWGRVPAGGRGVEGQASQHTSCEFHAAMAPSRSALHRDEGHCGAMRVNGVSVEDQGEGEHGKELQVLA